ncbi:SAM-dependent methyltransferase [Streptomyces aculeolatus]
MSEGRSPAEQVGPIDIGRAHPARVYDYLLYGKDNYPVDRALGDAVMRETRQARPSALANRAFMHRAIRYLAEEAGIRQFLDIGTGIPTEPNLHQVAQDVAPECRVVYVDNDPLVLAHARALMASTQQGRTAFINADMRDPESILADPALRNTLDLSRPVALSAIAVLHFVSDLTAARKILATLTDALAPGSHLVVSHATHDIDPKRASAAASVYQKSNATGWVTTRTHAEIATLFDGCELVPPGVVRVDAWRPDGLVEVGCKGRAWVYGGVGQLKGAAA